MWRGEFLFDFNANTLHLHHSASIFLEFPIEVVQLQFENFRKVEAECCKCRVLALPKKKKNEKKNTQGFEKMQEF